MKQVSALAAVVGLALPAIAQEKSEAGVKQNPLKDAYFGAADSEGR
jgi:hypothetical protein